MKNIMFLFCGLLLLASCSTVRFESPQPNDTKELKKMPSKLTGNYLDDDGDTLFVTKTSFILKEDEEKKLSSDRVALKKCKDFYVLSCKEILHGDKRTNLHGWDIILVKLLDDDLVCYSINTSTAEKEQAAITMLKDILPVEKLNDKDGRKEEYFMINPGKEEFEEIISKDIFSVVMEFKRID